MTGRVDVGSIRRAQIVEAAERVIVRQGIQNASLSEIEREARVSRGVLTYHFPSKEGLILAVFDAVVGRLKRWTGPPSEGRPSGWAAAEAIFEYVLTEKPRDSEFDMLQYAFLAQMAHRADFRERLAGVYGDMRARMAGHLAEEIRVGGFPGGDVEAVSAVVMGIVHGLVVQLNAEPDALDGRRLLGVMKEMVRGYLERPGRQRPDATE